MGLNGADRTMTSTTHIRAAIDHLRRFAADTRGATAIEYAIIAGGIAVAIVAAVTRLGSSTNTLFSNVSTLLK